MSIGWVAGSVRAEALLNRRPGTSGARALAGAASIQDALAVLAGTSYGHDVRPEHTLTEAEHAIGATLLWHMRVLAGWQPRPRGEIVRILASGFEISNVDDLVRHSGTAPYRLGTLSTAWQLLARAGSPAEVRTILATSAWGDPGTGSPAAIGLGMRLAWAERVIAGVPDAERWAYGAVALLVAREMFSLGRRLDGRIAERAAAILGVEPMAMTSLPDYVQGLPESARWALAGVGEPQDLWRAEAGWWTRVERDGFDLMHRARFDSRAVVGAIAVLAADAWGVRAALQLAARSGTHWRPSMPLPEAVQPVRMCRVALIAPQDVLREALVLVAQAGAVEFDELSTEDRQRVADGVSPRLSPDPPDLAAWESSGRGRPACNRDGCSGQVVRGGRRHGPTSPRLAAPMDTAIAGGARSCRVRTRGVGT